MVQGTPKPPALNMACAIARRAWLSEMVSGCQGINSTASALDRLPRAKSMFAKENVEADVVNGADDSLGVLFVAFFSGALVLVNGAEVSLAFFADVAFVPSSAARRANRTPDPPPHSNPSKEPTRMDGAASNRVGLPLAWTLAARMPRAHTRFPILTTIGRMRNLGQYLFSINENLTLPRF